MVQGFREPDRSDWTGAIVRIAIFVLAILGSAIALTYLWELPGLVLWIVLLVIATTWMIRWHTRTFGYRCPNCGETFAISAATNATSINLLARKYLRCPRCGKHAACKIMVITTDDAAPQRP